MTKKEVVKWLESLKKEIGKVENSTLWYYAEAIDMAIEALSAEAIQGKWIDTGNWMGFECSRCKCHSRYITPFCPQCGTRMKGRK